MSEPPWKRVLQPQLELQMAAAPADLWLQLRGDLEPGPLSELLSNPLPTETVKDNKRFLLLSCCWRMCCYAAIANKMHLVFSFILSFSVCAYVHVNFVRFYLWHSKRKDFLYWYLTIVWWIAKYFEGVVKYLSTLNNACRHPGSRYREAVWECISVSQQEKRRVQVFQTEVT